MDEADFVECKRHSRVAQKRIFSGFHLIPEIIMADAPGFRNLAAAGVQNLFQFRRVRQEKAFQVIFI